MTRSFLLLSTACLCVLSCVWAQEKNDPRSINPRECGKPFDVLSRQPTNTTRTASTRRPNTLNKSRPNGLTPTRRPSRPNQLARLRSLRALGAPLASNQRDWSWHVALLTANQSIMSGSLINSQWVLTRAHLVSNIKSVVVGAMSDIELRQVSMVIKNENFNPRTRENDIALVKLDRPIKYAATIAPVCLPASNEQVNFDSQQVTVTSFKSDPNGVVNLDDLRKTQQTVSLISDGTCRNRHEHPGIISFDSNSQFCSIKGRANARNDSLSVDYGAGAVRKQNSRWVEVGVLSDMWFFRKDQAFSTIYTRVSKYLNWIKEKVQSN